MSNFAGALRAALFSGVSALSLGALFAKDAMAVVSRDDVGTTAPRDTSNAYPWVGQMIDWSSAPTLSFGLCTGVVIAPRVVLFAAHCVGGVNGSGETFGATGKNMVFGFNPDNLPGLRRYVGLDPSTRPIGQTNVNDRFYRVIDVIGHPRNADNSFIAGTADLALAVLDTPIEGFDGMGMLFSQLNALETVDIAGYGNRGTGSTGQIGIDWWRRAGSNALSALMSDNQVFAAPLFGSAPPIPGGWDGANYWTDCDSPTVPRPSGDFNVFGGAALANEACIAQGDSGGSMFVTRGGQKISIGVASYGYSTGPSFGHGAFSAHTALFSYWDFIVANNAYVYASAKAGGGDWDNAATWIQTLNPNYFVSGPGGTLVNALPTTDPASNTGTFTQVGSVRPPPATPVPNTGDVSGPQTATMRVDISGNIIGGDLTPWDGTVINPENVRAEGATAAVLGVGSGFWPIGVAPLSGAGSTNFVPSNTNGTIGTPFVGAARFYDINLSNAGTVTLSSAKTIDRLSISGASSILSVSAGGSLTSVMTSTVSGGNLTVNGTFNTRGLNITGGKVQGTGSISINSTLFPTVNNVRNSGGMVAPGNSIGTLNILGNYEQGLGGLLEIEMSAGTSDVLAVTGNASLAGTVRFTQFGSAPTLGQTNNFITTGGTVSGRFSSVQDFLPGGLFPVLTYGNNFVRVTMANFCSFATSEVEAAICAALDGNTVQTDADMASALGGLQALDSAQFSLALEALSPTRANAQSTAAFSTGDLMRGQFSQRMSGLLGGSNSGGVAQMDLARTQLASAAPSSEALASAAAAALAAGTAGMSDIALENGYGIFFAGDFAIFETEQAGGIGTDKADAAALTVGLDHSDGQGFVAGLAASYLQSQVAQDYGLGGNTSSDGLALSAFASMDRGALSAEVYASGAWHSFETERTLLLAPFVNGIASGETDATQIQAGASVSYDLFNGESVKLDAVGGLHYANVDIDAYTETGVGALGAAVAARSVDSLRSQLGGELAFILDDSKSLIVPTLRVVWNHEFMDDSVGVTSGFAGAPGATYTAPGAELGTDWATVGLGVSSQVSADTNFYLRVQKDFGRDGAERHEVSAAARFGF